MSLLRSVGRFLSLLAAAIAAVALIAQLGLTIRHMTAEGATVNAAIWRYLGLFTYYANAGVVVAGLSMATSPAPGPVARRAHLAAVTIIAMVGIVWSLLLRSMSTAEGWELVASHALHDVVPPLFLSAWLTSAHGGLWWRDAVWVALPPLTYSAYALTRGLADGWYPYWFVDAAALGFGKVAQNMGMLLMASVVMGLLLVAVDRWLAGRR